LTFFNAVFEKIRVNNPKLYMTTQAQIDTYIASQPEPKRSELQAWHDLVLQVSPACQLWFSDGKNSDGKIVSNPNIGYGCYTIQYVDGWKRRFGLGWKAFKNTEHRTPNTEFRNKRSV